MMDSILETLRETISLLKQDTTFIVAVLLLALFIALKFTLISVPPFN